MRTYSTERKESVLRKLSNCVNYRALSREEGIPLSTIYTWQKQRGERTTKMGNIKVRKATRWTSEERFSAIVETAKLNEIELSEYCREKGLYPEQLNEWRAAFIENESKANSSQPGKTQSKADKKRISQLEKELRRKEKALAEAAALLILRKKLDAFYGEGGEED